MTGDFTSAPLRDGDPWTGARLQQGRVLLDGDWNLNIDAAARDRQRLARDTIGPAGVPQGSTNFMISFAADGTLQIGAGSMWVGGLYAVNPATLAYTAQESIAALPASGQALLYLDAFVQEVQAAEDPGELLDPALDGVDTTTRTRVGVAGAGRARARRRTARDAAGTLPTELISTGRLDIVLTAPTRPRRSVRTARRPARQAARRPAASGGARPRDRDHRPLRLVLRGRRRGGRGHGGRHRRHAGAVAVGHVLPERPRRGQHAAAARGPAGQRPAVQRGQGPPGAGRQHGDAVGPFDGHRRSLGPVPAPLGRSGGRGRERRGRHPGRRGCRHRVHRPAGHLPGRRLVGDAGARQQRRRGRDAHRCATRRYAALHRVARRRRPHRQDRAQRLPTAVPAADGD